MKTVNYILVDDVHPRASAQGFDHRYVHQPEDAIVIQQVVEDGDLVQRRALIRELCRLRRRFPEAKILGVSEIDGKRIRVSDEMNALRRALSDLP